MEDPFLIAILNYPLVWGIAFVVIWAYAKILYWEAQYIGIPELSERWEKRSLSLQIFAWVSALIAVCGLMSY